MKYFSVLVSIAFAAVALGSCSNDDPAPVPSQDSTQSGTQEAVVPYLTQQEFQGKVVGRIWSRWEEGNSFRLLTGDNIQVDPPNGGYQAMIAFKVNPDGTVTEFQMTTLPGTVPYKQLLITSPAYTYDPSTGILEYDIHEWNGTLNNRKYHITSVTDQCIVYNENYGILPLGYSEDPDAIYDNNIPDPDSHEEFTLICVPVDKEQEYYDNYEPTSFPME